jgi:hypothetical protein
MKIISLILLFTAQSYAQTQFQVDVGSSSCDMVTNAIQTYDGGYAICGQIQNSDMYVVKFDPEGNLQWTRKVGGAINEIANSIVQTTDGNYVVCGYTLSFGAGNLDMYFVKLNSSGSVIWNKTVGGSAIDNAVSIIQTTDGGSIAAGYTYSFGEGNADMFIVKLDSSGNLQWSKTIGGTGHDNAWSIIKTADGGYILAGETLSYGADDMFIVKLDSNFMLKWSKTIGGTDDDYANYIFQSSDGGYGVIGDSWVGAYSYIYAARLDSSGNIEWSNKYINSNDEYGYTMNQTSDGNFIIGGYSDHGQYYGCLFKLSPVGAVQWGKILPCDGTRIMKTTDGGYVVAGSSNLAGAGCYDFCIVKYDSSWNSCQSLGQLVFTPLSYGTYSSPVPIESSQTPVVTTPTPTTSTEGVVTNICTTVGVTNKEKEIPKDYNLYQNYPNPFNPTTNIKFDLPVENYVSLKIYDMLGREIAIIKSEQLKSGTHEFVWNASNYPSGIYFYKLISGDYAETKRMVIIK